MSNLPKTMSTISKRIQDFTMLLYGPPKIGKSTFTSKIEVEGFKFNRPLFLATEPGLKHLNVYKKKVSNWPIFRRVVQDLEKHKKWYGVRVVDTTDVLFKQCVRYVCDKRNLEHPSDEEWGKGYDIILTEFAKWILRLIYLPGGTVFISHSQDKEMRSRMMKINKTMPTLTGSCRKVIIPLVDIIGYCGFDIIEKGDETIEKRVMLFEPSETLEAGDRTGRLPDKIALSYKAFRKAFYDKK